MRTKRFRMENASQLIAAQMQQFHWLEFGAAGTEQVGVVFVSLRTHFHPIFTFLFCANMDGPDAVLFRC